MARRRERALPAITVFVLGAGKVGTSLARALRELPGWEAVLLRTTPLVGRPAIPRDLAGRVTVRTARDGAGCCAHAAGSSYRTGDPPSNPGANRDG